MPTAAEVNFDVRLGTAGKYKSIGALRWENVPMLSIITGLNGSGKSQLLEVLAFGLSKSYDSRNLPMPLEVVVEGDQYRPEEVACYSSSLPISPFQSVGITQLQQETQNLAQQFQYGHNYNHDRKTLNKKRRLDKIVGRDITGMSQQDLLRFIGDDLSFMIDEVDVASSLSTIFFSYRLRYLEELDRCLSPDLISKTLGPAPWDVLNRFLATAQFPYQVTTPKDVKLTDLYTPKFLAHGSSDRLGVDDLSSGEQVILQLLCWLYNSEHNHKFPRLFLLDEPDAHLHPTMTQQFLDVVDRVLVKTYGVRVIIVTHSPSTVALAPKGSLFKMQKTDPRIEKSQSQTETIGLLTSGIVTVSKATKYVFVEDQGDVDFYEAVRSILTDYGPRKDQFALATAPSIVFLPASIGKGSQKISGGESMVKKMIDKFDMAPLSELFCGLKDRDKAASASRKIEIIGRYSYENYLLDPLNVFALLISNGTPIDLPNIEITKGDEYHLYYLPQEKLQSIIDRVCSIIQKSAGALLEKYNNVIAVDFTNGQRFRYPSWVIDYRGHDLLQIFQDEFGGAKAITPPRLIDSFQRIRLMPIELAQILAKIQKS